MAIQLAFVLLAAGLTGCRGWTTTTTTTTRRAEPRLRRTDVGTARISSSTATALQGSPSFVLLARPPPTANFDLESIEAFENEIDAAAVEADGDGEVDFARISVDKSFIDEVTDDDDDLLDDDDDEINIDANNHVRSFTVPPELDGKRVDAVLAELIEPSLSRSVCGNLVANGNVRQVRSDDDPVQSVVLDRKSHKVDAGTVLRVELPDRDGPLTDIVAQDLPLSILYEDRPSKYLPK